MVDVMNKVVGILIAFVMLVVAPTIMMRVIDDASMRRQLLNEVEMFIDKVTDAGSLDVQSLDSFNATVNSHGVPFSVKIVKYEKVAVPEALGDYSVVYIPKEDSIRLVPHNDRIRFEVGDVMQVMIEALTPTQGQLLVARWLKQATEPISITLAGTVR